MAAKMTRRERVLRTIRFEEVDCIACYDIIENDAVIAHYGGEWPTVENGKAVKGRAIGRCLDMTRMAEGPRAEGRHTDPDGHVWQDERWTSWICERPYNNFDEFKDWVHRKIKTLNAWQPSEEEVCFWHDYVRDTRNGFAADSDDPEDPTILVLESATGVDAAYSRCGLEYFSELMFMAPELCDAWIEANNQAEIRRAHAIADKDLVPVVLTHDDLASKNGPIFSPDWIREHQIPRLKRLVEAWHEHGVYCLFHSDGDLRPILEDLVSTGIDGLNPIETCAGMSITQVRENYPDLFIAGGIDVSNLLPMGTPEEVQARCLEAIEEANGRGYFLGSTTEILPTVPAENVAAMLETPKVLAGERT